MKERVTGIWRSYKILYFSGKVETHNDTTYLELSVDEQEAFIFLHSQVRRAATTFTKEQWHIEMLKNRWYIFLQKKQAFEIITLETEDLVLLDIVKGEKIFFAKLPLWHKRVEPIITSVRQIHSGKEKSHR